MLGKASEIKTDAFTEDFIGELSLKINAFLKQHPSIEVIDIQYRMAQPDNGDFLFHTALIIYKEESA